MAQSPLLTIGVWQKKSAEVSFQNKDLLISAVNKGFNAMAAVLSKDSDPDEVQCALDLLNCERSIALRYDKSKDDSLRDLMYGVLESLHVSLKEWTEERNQVKKTGEIPTQTVESSVSLIGPLIRPCESSILIDSNLSNLLTTNLNPPPSFPIEPKEEPIDNHYSLPHDYQISVFELMRDEKMLKEEEMDNESTELVTPHSNTIFPNSLDLIDQMPPLHDMRDDMDFKEEEMPNDDMNFPRDSIEDKLKLDDVENSEMDDVVNDSLNEQPFEENDSLRTMQPSDIIYCQMNFDDEISGDNDQCLAEKNSLNEVSMSDSHNETSEPETGGEERGSPVNDVKDNKREEEEAVDHPTAIPMNKKKRKSSRKTSRTIQYDESMRFDGEDAGPSISRLESSRKKRKSYKGEEETSSIFHDHSYCIKKRRVSKKNETELECPECEYRTCSAPAWIVHLRLKHTTTPTLAGLALLCECGNESASNNHSLKCAHGNIIVISKRGGPIRRLDDEKVTPQCVLCEIYPKTARGYAAHLELHHKSTLAQNGVYLKCSCGLEVRSSHDREHAAECNRRQFTLHKLDDE